MDGWKDGGPTGLAATAQDSLIKPSPNAEIQMAHRRSLRTFTERGADTRHGPFGAHELLSLGRYRFRARRAHSRIAKAADRIRWLGTRQCRLIGAVGFLCGKAFEV